MTSRKTLDQILEEEQVKIAQAKARIKRAKQQETTKQRKARTHRLIQVGAILEANLNIEFNDEQRNQLTNLLAHEHKTGKTVRQWLAEEISKQPTTDPTTTDPTTRPDQPTTAPKPAQSTTQKQPQRTPAKRKPVQRKPVRRKPAATE